MEVNVGGEGEPDGGRKVGLNHLDHLYRKMTRMRRKEYIVGEARRVKTLRIIQSTEKWR